MALHVAVRDDVPRVLIDGYFFDRAYGFGRYVRELVHAFDRWLDDFEPILLLPVSAVDAARSLTKRTRLVGRPRRLFPLWEQWVVPAVARENGCDLIHFPYQSTAFTWPRARTVATVHDLMFLRAKQTAAALPDRVAHLYRRVLYSVSTRHAGELIAVSEATRRELAAVSDVAATVVENSCEAFVTAHRHVRPATSEGRFYLHRGDRGPHKNTRRIVQAFAAVRRDVPDLRLLVFGGSVGADVFEGLPSDGVETLGKVSDERLAALYKASVAVVAPSLEEGFGLALIEAMGFGAPVITSDRSPMRELGTGAGILVDPDDVGQIEGAMRRLIAAPQERQEMVRRGALRYQQFSSRQVAAKLGAVYGRALGMAPLSVRGVG